MTCPAPHRTNNYQIYHMFTDNGVRQHFNEYDAIAVLDWKNVEMRGDSLARLYHEVFDRPRSRRWWIMAADARPLDAREAEERHEIFEKRLLGSGGGGGGSGSGNGHLVWGVNGKAVVCKEACTHVCSYICMRGNCKTEGWLQN